METQEGDAPAPRSITEIPLNELPEQTKDFLIAHSAGGLSVPAVIIGVLNEQAAKQLGKSPAAKG